MPGGHDIGAETLRRMRAVSRYNDWIVARIRPWLGNRVLEAGAGTGTFSRFLLDRERLVLTDIRRSLRPTASPPRALIRSFTYFRPIIEEVINSPPDLGSLYYLNNKLDQLEEHYRLESDF